MSPSRTSIAAAVAVALLALAGCGTAPAQPEPTPASAQPRAEIVDMASDPDQVVNGPAGPQTGFWNLTVCLLDTTGEPTDDCMTVHLSQDEYDGYDIGDPYPVDDTNLLGRDAEEEA